MTLETSKLLGEIGALLLVVSPFGGSIGNALGLVGLVLLLVVFNDLAEHYGDRAIFRNVLWGIVIFVVGVVIAAAIISIAAAGALTQIGLQMSSWSDPASWQGVDWNGLNYNALAPYFAAMIIALIILFAMTVVAAFYMRKSFLILSHRTGVGMFATSGLILLIGAILTIVLIGFLLLWIAMILLAIAFFRWKIERPVPVQPVISNEPSIRPQG
ncbi:MAG: DUF996 domain-containing protein [Methanomassiliicoccus sp.]|nr:DUF996 domain-containing protein [Methanomassiliicoccus sp.]